MARNFPIETWRPVPPISEPDAAFGNDSFCCRWTKEHVGSMWQPAETAPFDRELELAVIDPLEVHALIFPCRRVAGGWVNATTKEGVEIHPTHWRDWLE